MMNITNFREEASHMIIVYVDQDGAKKHFDLTAHIDERIAQAPPNAHANGVVVSHEQKYHGHQL